MYAINHMKCNYCMRPYAIVLQERVSIMVDNTASVFFPLLISFCRILAISLKLRGRNRKATRTLSACSCVILDRNSPPPKKSYVSPSPHTSPLTPRTFATSSKLLIFAGKQPRTATSSIPGSPKTKLKTTTVGGRPNRAQMLRQQQGAVGSKRYTPVRQSTTPSSSLVPNAAHLHRLNRKIPDGKT